MSIRKQNEAYLYHSSKNNAVLTYDFQSVQRYVLNNFYVCGNDYKVPISIIKYFPWEDSVYDNVVAVGRILNTIYPLTPLTHDNNRALLVSKEYYAYNPDNYYRVRVKGMGSGDVQCGFVTWTSSPITNLLDISADENLNAMFNISRFAMSKDGLGINSAWDSGDSISSLTNNNMIPTNSNPIGFGDYQEGYMARFNAPVGAGDGFEISSFMSSQNKILYFSPYVLCNVNSTSNVDWQVTYIDDIIVEEFWDTYSI